MGWCEAWNVAICAVAFAGVGVAVVLTVGAAAPGCIAMFAVVEGSSTLTAAGVAAVAAEDYAKAAVDSQFTNVDNAIHEKKR